MLARNREAPCSTSHECTQIRPWSQLCPLKNADVSRRFFSSGLIRSGQPKRGGMSRIRSDGKHEVQLVWLGLIGSHAFRKTVRRIVPISFDELNILGDRSSRLARSCPLGKQIGWLCGMTNDSLPSSVRLFAWNGYAATKGQDTEVSCGSSPASRGSSDSPSGLIPAGSGPLVPAS